jgi:hypothetical protein
MFAPANSSAEDFKVMWKMEIPRATYFIGETLSLTVTAFASTDPELKIPGEMALVTIRNQSLVEVYSGWITTNSNGSAPVSWDIDIESDSGNYTIILKPINGESVTEKIMVLYNEETYWKERVNELEEDQNKMYEYVNYLFSYNQWLTRQFNFWKNVVKWTFAITFAVLFIGLWVFFPELARRSRTEKGIYAQFSKGLNALGMSSEPRIYLEFEEVAQLEVPKDKAAPREHATNFCTVCDPDMKNPMTLMQMEDHIRMHDKSYLQKGAWKGKLRKRSEQKKSDKKVEPEMPEPAYGTVKEYSDKWNDKQKKTDLKIRLKVLKDLKKKHKISPEKFSEELNKVKNEVVEIKKKHATEPIEPEPTSQKPLLQRKVREERRISTPKNSISGNSNPKTPIDELFEKLSNEKVS